MVLLSRSAFVLALSLLFASGTSVQAQNVPSSSEAVQTLGQMSPQRQEELYKQYQSLSPGKQQQIRNNLSRLAPGAPVAVPKEEKVLQLPPSAPLLEEMSSQQKEETLKLYQSFSPGGQKSTNKPSN